MLVTLNFQDVEPFLDEIKKQEIQDIFYGSHEAYRLSNQIKFAGWNTRNNILVTYTVPLPEGVDKSNYSYSSAGWTMDDQGNWVKTFPDRRELRHQLTRFKVEEDLIASFMKKSTTKLRKVAVSESTRDESGTNITERTVTVSEEKALFTFPRRDATKPVEVHVLLGSGFHGERELRYRVSVPAEDNTIIEGIKKSLTDGGVRLIRGSIDISLK
jgi:hypothetical protein